VGKLVQPSESKNYHVDYEVDKLVDACREIGKHEILGAKDIKHILDKYLMEVDSRVADMLREGVLNGKLSKKECGRCNKEIGRHNKSLLHDDVMQVLRDHHPFSHIYSMDEVERAFRCLFRKSPSINRLIMNFEGSSEDITPKNLGRVRSSSWCKTRTPDKRIKIITPGTPKTTPRRYRQQRQRRTSPVKLPRGRSGYEDLVLVKPNLALYEGRQKVAKAHGTLEKLSKLEMGKTQSEMVSKALDLLGSALKDLLDEINASTRGEWDDTTIDKQRADLSGEEQKALDFVLATTKDLSLVSNATSSNPSTPRDEDNALSLIKSFKTNINGRAKVRRGSRSRSISEDRLRTNDDRDSLTSPRVRRSSARSPSPASIHLRSVDRKGRVKHLLKGTAQNNNILKISNLNPSINKWLKHADSWDKFDVWQFANAADGFPLSILFLHYMEQGNLFTRCAINRNAFINFVRQLEQGYNDVPYHNNIHATDVLHAAHFMMKSKVFSEACERVPLLRLACYLAAAAHDFRHPGTNNEYAKNTQSEVAIRYNDISILENMHIAETFKLIKQGKQCNFLQCLEQRDQQLVRRFVISMVLHTDMAKHNDLVVKLKRLIKSKDEKDNKSIKWLELDQNPKDLMNETEFLLDMMIHCADLANACRPNHIMKEWTRRVIKEFWSQGDKERENGLQIGPGRDRNTANVPLGQQFFIKVLVSPLYTLWKEVVPESDIALKLLHKNLEFWTNEAEKEKERKANADRMRKKVSTVTKQVINEDSTSVGEKKSTVKEKRRAFKPLTEKEKMSQLTI